MTTRLRDAVPADLAGIVAVFLACWRENYQLVLPPRRLAAMDDARATALWTSALAAVPPGGVVVAAHDERIVGVTRYRPGPETATGVVESLYVSPEAQGTGLGAQLLTTSVDRLRQSGTTLATLWVFAANTSSIGFYRRQGFEPDGARRIEAGYGALEIRLARRVDTTTAVPA